MSPGVWQDLEPDVVYTIGRFRVAFSKDVLKTLAKTDPRGKHYKAIEKGPIAPRGQANGLVRSEEPGYRWKTKVLGKGGAMRVHGRYLEEEVLYFDLITWH